MQFSVFCQEYSVHANAAIERTVVWVSICTAVCYFLGKSKTMMELKHLKSIFSDLIFHALVQKTFYLPSFSLDKGFFNSTVVVSQEKRDISFEM